MMPQGVPRTKADDLRKAEAMQRTALLNEFNVMTEEQLATLFGVEVKTLKNRPADDLPPFSRTGGKRLFFKTDVLEFLKRRRGS
jgi:hypothetical protein